MFKNPKNVVIAYISIVCVYTLLFTLQNKSNISLLDSSGLGDFLSGLFAPIAFLYLFLGHKQQEKALNKTNQDLLNQLKIQKQMLDLQIADQRAREHAALPIIKHSFDLRDFPCESKITGKPDDSFLRVILIELHNSGEKVSQVDLVCISPFRGNIVFNQVLDNSCTLKAKLSISESKLHDHNEDGFVNMEIQLSYTTKLGIKYKTIYEVQVTIWPEDSHIIYGGILNTIRCNN